MRRTSLKWGAGTAFAGAAVLTVSALTLSPSAYSQQPNVGTVKIDNVDLGSVPNNEPHVPDCEFEVEFFGYPANQVVTATITHVPPTGDGSQSMSETITLDGDDESGGGSAAGFDGATTFDATALVAGTEPQPNQGWHLRLDVEDGQVGGTKTKVFWVEGCAPVQPTTTSTTTTTTTTTTQPTTTTTTAPAGPTTTAAPGAPARPSGAAAPPARPPAPGAVTPRELAFTGTNSSLALVGVALVLVGAGLSLAVRRRLAG
jgi:hypothetical protein